MLGGDLTNVDAFTLWLPKYSVFILMSRLEWMPDEQTIFWLVDERVHYRRSESSADYSTHDFRVVTLELHARRIESLSKSASTRSCRSVSRRAETNGIAPSETTLKSILGW